jgi:hypothetical protein
MSNPIFYASDMSDAVFTMSEAEDTAYPLNNLHTNIPSLQWMSSTKAASQTLNIDMGSVKGCDFIALGEYDWNLLSGAKLQVGATDDGNFASPVNLLTSFTGSAPIVFPFGFTTRRYWRILFTNTEGALGWKPSAGLLYLGYKMTMPFNYNMDAELGNKQYSTTSKESLSGILRTSRQVGGRARAEVSFTLIDDATVTAWQLFMETIQGRLNPFFFKDDSGVLDIYHSEDDYIPAKGVRANVSDIARIKMCKQTTG